MSASSPRHLERRADVDHVRTLIRAGGVGYALVSPRRRPSPPRAAATRAATPAPPARVAHP
jgi:hypothetical protein